MVKCRNCNKNYDVLIGDEKMCIYCFDEDRRKRRPVVINVPEHKHKRIVI